MEVIMSRMSKEEMQQIEKKLKNEEAGRPEGFVDLDGPNDSYVETGFTADQESLGLTGSAGLTTNSGVFGDKGMSSSAEAFNYVGGMGNIGTSTSKNKNS
jgi:hypothetical protein